MDLCGKRRSPRKISPANICAYLRHLWTKTKRLIHGNGLSQYRLHNLGLRRTADIDPRRIRPRLSKNLRQVLKEPHFFDAAADPEVHPTFRHAACSLPVVMGTSHNHSRCHAPASCVPGSESLSCLSAGSLLRPHSSQRVRAGCCESGSRACTLGNGKVKTCRLQKAADSLAHSHTYVHTLLVLPIGCFDSWKGEIFAVSC